MLVPISISTPKTPATPMTWASRRPRWTYQPMIVTAQNIISGAPFDDSGTDSPILADFRAKVNALDIEQDDKDRLVSEAENCADRKSGARL